MAVHWAAYVLVYASGFGLPSIASWITIWHFLFFRFGFVPILVATLAKSLLGGFPLTSDLSAWYAHATLLDSGSIHR